MPASERDVTGHWEAIITLKFGEGRAVFQMEQSGERLNGTYEGALGQATLEGDVYGENLKWHFSDSRVGQIQFTGTLTAGDRIEGTTQYGKYARGTFIAERKR